ncbi:MAG: hypothetical protein ABIE22_01115 [archaeon]
MGKINALVILEMLGRPKEYLKETMEGLVEKVGKEKGVNILKKKINEAKEIEEKGIFSCFTELEVEFEDINSMLIVTFLYMPSHIEVVTPEQIKIKNADLDTMFNELCRRLHQYDEIAKRLTIENTILKKRFQEVLEKAGMVKVQENSKPKRKVKKAVKKTTKKKKKS